MNRHVPVAVLLGLVLLAPDSRAEFAITDPELAAEVERTPAPGPSLTLPEAVTAADARNLTLQATRIEIDRADARLAQAWALVMPMAQAGLNYTRADHPDVVDFGESLAQGLGPIFEAAGITLPPMESDPTVIRRQDTLSGSLTANMSVINLANWFSISAARKGRDVAERSVEAARQQLLVGVAQAHQTALMSSSLCLLQAAQVKAAAHHLDVATKRFESGAALRIEVVRAETNLAEARQQLLNARLSLESARDALGVLTGLGGLPMPAEGPNLPPPTGSDVELVARALDHRPDVALLRDTASLANRQFNAAWAGFLPTVDVVWQGTYQFTQPSSMGSPDRSRWNLMFSLNVPIFRYFTIGGLREASAATRIAQLKLDDSVQGAGREVRQARRDYDAAQASAKLAQQQAALAREAMTLAATAYDAGAGSSLEVTDATRTLMAAEVNRATRDLQTQIALLVLHKALGTDIRTLFP